MTAFSRGCLVYGLHFYAPLPWNFLRQIFVAKLYCSKPEDKTDYVSGKGESTKWAKVVRLLDSTNLQSFVLFNYLL